MADAYAPIIRSVLMIGCAYYIYVTWSHWQDESGQSLAILGSISTLTAFSYYMLRQHALAGKSISLLRLELASLAMNMLMYMNVLSYFMIHFEQAKLVYFALMAVIFSTTGVTLRGTLFSVIVSLATLFWFASGLSDQLFMQYVSIGVATAFASFSMASLLRKAILQQIDARLLADELASKARQLADTDTLTGIPNRRAVFEKIDYLVQQRRPFWMGIFDLDGFKAINDVYGHMVGDTLLRAVVTRATELDFDGATFGRIGGDEFIAILPGHLSEEKIGFLGNCTIEAISRPYPVDLMHLKIGASAGFSHFPSMGASGAQLYEKADYALYKAKTQSRGHCVLFDTAEDVEMKLAIEIERELREGDLEKELFLLFQPQYSPKQKRVVGFEALARWQNPKLGLVRPDLFIRAAERSGHIRTVTDILFRKGLAELAGWPRDISLSFNLSAQDISNHAFMLSLMGQIMDSGIAPSRLEFEITETAVMSDLEKSRTLLEQLRASGCKIALDDFGSGYSSFEYIDQLPLDKVKIDRSFVRKVSHSVTSKEIVAGVIGLCRKLDLRCVLEGVETEAEMDVLGKLEPDLIQGYLFGRPMNPQEARRRIMDQDGAPVHHAEVPRSA
ncbi:putative bifunctional diguanylate cyclase/phosphodiesterase [Hoeflea alexandrii]|uniref:putative bifunctional diguanylate cyclase/phosphodiesterase n=1 Tax=Hoeflea alexandrii TaxID=288436 RepID=UPI0022AFEE74|nr:EAL domain-containing protein [Hoeflea alexandrii]MCZ4289981.1 EAL domain-containing protein [Hoeflea alexandrii]